MHPVKKSKLGPGLAHPRGRFGMVAPHALMRNEGGRPGR